MGLTHVVITSVTRDDLPDGGAAHFASTVKAIRKTSPHTTIEVLIPDFQGSTEALKTVVDSAPEVINHNVETVPRLYPQVRPGADASEKVAWCATRRCIATCCAPFWAGPARMAGACAA